MNYYERFSVLVDRIEDPVILEALLEQIPLFTDYVKAVVKYKTGIEIAEKLYSGEEKSEYIYRLDVARHGAHEAVIVSCKMIDRIAGNYGFRVFEGVDLENRYEVATAVGKFVNLMYSLEIANSRA